MVGDPPGESRGFPDGARGSSVPDLFFSRDLPAIDDPVALKLMLHLLWRIQRRPTGSPPAQRAADLAADPTLRRGLSVLGLPEADLGAAIRGALVALARRGLLLAAPVAGDAAPETWWLVADRQGRETMARLEAEGRLLSQAVAPRDLDGVPAYFTRAAADGATLDVPPWGAEPVADPVPERPNIFVLYEEHIGLLSPLVAETLTDAARDYPPGWIEDAFRLAAEANVRKWAYVRAILERWAREGRGDDVDGASHEGDRRDSGRRAAAAGRQGGRQEGRKAGRRGEWEPWVRR
jgi:DnaD/phage-associated family protein